MASVGGELSHLMDKIGSRSYLERLEYSFHCEEGYKDEEKVGVLLSVLSPEVYEKLRYLMKPK